MIRPKRYLLPMTILTSASAHQLAQMIRDRQVSAIEVLDAHLEQIERHNSQLNAALEPWDVWLTPVAATAAFTGAYTIPFNLSGHPAVVIPIGQTAAGLPIGVQLVGKRWREMELLAIAQELDPVIGDFRSPSIA
jgi:Asp-tRNA(Asn)/Glu-tRNA(Gln) amidotransferase A subunit family amidase